MISVIITTYGRPKYLEEAIKSVIDQKKQPLEIIVVDDNGKDTENNKETRQIIKKLSNSLVKLLEHDKNYGANKARNTGIHNSNGKFIAFLDDDDLFYNNKIMETEKVLRENNEIDLIYSGANYKYKYFKRYKYIDEKNEKNKILQHNFIGSNSFVVVRKSTLLELDGFDEKLKSCQDWDMWTRIIYNGYTIKGIDKPLVKYRVFTGEKISNNREKKIQGHKEYFKKIQRYLEEFSECEREVLKAYQLKRFAYIDYQDKNYNEFTKKYNYFKEKLPVTKKEKIRYLYIKILLKYNFKG